MTFNVEHVFFFKIGESHWFSRPILFFCFFFGGGGGGGGGGGQGSDDVIVSDRFSSENFSNPAIPTQF